MGGKVMKIPKVVKWKGNKKDGDKLSFSVEIMEITSMKSPFTSGAVVKMSRNDTFQYKGENFTIEREYYRCVDTGTTFTDSELDQKAWDAVIKQYNEKHRIDKTINK